ncbi:MAG: serine protease [Enterovibrio sp.]
MHYFTFSAHSLRRMATFLASSIAALTAIGCIFSNGPLQTVETNNAPAIDFEMTGIPPLYMGYGSSVPVTENLSLTAAHVAKLNYARVIAYHPTCDIALIAADNRGEKLPNLGVVYKDQSVKAYGVNFNGKILQGEGRYRRDLRFVNYFYFYKCPASVMDAPIQTGMSGGGTFNSFGELVGIIVASADKSDTRLVSGEMLPDDRISLFVSVNYVRGWLNEAVKKYYGDGTDRLVWRQAVYDDGPRRPKKKRNYVLRH